ncbi:MAG: cobalamin biosynthesis protein [Hyphomicrobiales bacterium]|nr:cobalamin biosynthesis protein [Hyphomicrobiales bacterium]
MRLRFAIGIGCRKGCASANIVVLVRQALALVSRSDLAIERTEALRESVIFTSEAKRDEEGLAEAAAILGTKLVCLPRAELEAAAPRCATRSPRVQELVGLPSLAEAAALAGAGEDSRLVLARITESGASCALAVPTAVAAEGAS